MRDVSERTLISKIVFWLLAIALVGVMWVLGIREPHAGELYGAVTLHSYHVDRTAGYNEHNYGAGLEYQFNRTWCLVIGEYRNSFDRRSAYYGGAYTPFRAYEHWKAGVLVLKVNGYDVENLHRYTPIAVPLIAWERERLGANLVFVPPIGHKTGMLGLQGKVKF